MDVTPLPTRRPNKAHCGENHTTRRDGYEELLEAEAAAELAEFGDAVCDSGGNDDVEGKGVDGNGNGDVYGDRDGGGGGGDAHG